MKQNILLLILPLLLVACGNDGGETPPAGKIGVTFSVTLPDQEDIYPNTRAAYTDTDINNADVLVFDETNKFMERIPVNTADITVTAAGVNFTIELDATPNNRTFHLVANGRVPGTLADRVNFSSITTGMLESAAIPALKTGSLASLTGATALFDNIMPLVMWSRVTTPGINVASSVTGVKLLRAAACIKVTKGSNADANGTFTLNRICFQKAADMGNIAPATYNAAPTATPATANPATIATYMDYSKTFSEASATPVAYVYEKNCTAADYTAIILEASWKGRTGYYKVVMTDGSGNPLHIVRNHRYNITVTDVYGYGCASAADAVSAAPSNDLKVNITVDTDREYPCVISDGQYAMGITGHSVHAYGRRSGQTTTSAVELCRVYSTRGVAPGNFTTSNSPAWLTNFTATSVSTNVWKITADLVYSASLGATVNTVLTVCCDNLSHDLGVAWTHGYNAASATVALVATDDKNWKVSVEGEPNWVWLHPTNSTAGYSGSGLVHELSSAYYTQAHMHVQAGTADRRAELSQSSTSRTTNEATAKKIIVIQ